MLQLPEALAPLSAYRQFIVCQFVPDPAKPGKTIKWALDPKTGKVCNEHDPAIWMDYDTAARVAETWGVQSSPSAFGHGVGFSFGKTDPFWFIDVDSCLIDATPDTPAHWSPIVSELMAELPGAAVEVSQSGRGIHIFGTGSVPAERRVKDHTNQLFDLYTEGRFAAFGSNGAQGSIATDCTPGLHRLVERHLKRSTQAGAAPATWTDGPVPEWRGPVDDEALIARAIRTKSTAQQFGSKATFEALWTGDVDALARAYPPDPNSNDLYNASSADAGLAQALAFWTGNDCARIERLMRQSALARPKWDERADYLAERTILGCVARQTQVCQDKPAELPPRVAGLPDDAPQATLRTGATILDAGEQIKLFTGCVYVLDAHRILIPGGHMVRAEQFKVMYGGYSFPIDLAGTKQAKDPWDAFSQSQSFRAPRADGMCFKPGSPPGAILTDAGRTRVNTYWPVEVPRKAGDPAPLLRHLSILLPDERDQKILLSYMAACVQHQGVKFQWAPMIQGVEGNGKTILTLCVAEAVGRRYTHWPAANKLSSQFNKWLFGKVFYGVEDIYVAGDKGEVIEQLKPMITGQELEIEGKGIDQSSEDVCGNFIFNSNHQDGIRKTANDRRFAMFFCRQQKASHLERDGLTEDYFRKLVHWLKHEDGHAIVSEFLYTYPIDPEFNPAGGQRAPITTSTERAIAAGLSPVEQEVNEAIEQRLPGFCGGWISTIMLDRLLERVGMHKKMSRNKRADLLESLGYVLHPGLPSGRATVAVSPDAGAPRLYVLHGHRSLYLAGAAVGTAYARAQNPETADIINY